MTPKLLHPILSATILMLAMLACVLPGQAIQSVPVTNPVGVETAIVGTARAAETQTEQARPVTSTPTMIPTASLTPTPKISVSGMSLIVREDQSTLFIDYKAGIQLVIPAGWMSLRLNEDEYLKAFASDVVLQNPSINEHLTIIRDLNVDVFRLDAIDTRPGHIPDGIISNISVVFEAGRIQSLEKWEQAERKRHHPYAQFKFISSKYPTLNDGRRVLVIEQRWAASHEKKTIYYRGVFFSLPTGTVVLDFYTNYDFKDTVLPDFEQVVNSLTLLNP